MLSIEEDDKALVKSLVEVTIQSLHYLSFQHHVTIGTCRETSQEKQEGEEAGREEKS